MIIAEGNYKGFTWEIDSDGTLTVRGEGEVHFSRNPWGEYADKVRKFKVEDGVTNISAELINYPALVSVEFPDTLIYDFCDFRGCENLAEITVPDSVVSVEDESLEDSVWYKSQPDGGIYIGKVFYGFKGEYTGGEEFTVRDGTLGIARGAFDVTGITCVNLPASIRSVSHSAFNKSVLNMDIGGGWSFWHGTICIWNGTRDFPDGDNPPWYTFRDKIKVVNVEYVSISGGTIGRNAFKDCPNLETVDLQGKIKEIRTGAFADCPALKTVEYTENIEVIERGAFSGCRNLTEISAPRVTEMSGAELQKFNEENPIKYVCPPEFEGLKRQGLKIGSYGKEFTWTLDKDGTMSIYGEGEMPNDEKYFGEQPFNKWKVRRVRICNYITKIGRSAFADFTGIMQIVFPKNLKEIGDNAFYRCWSLSEVTLPETTEVIGAGAFHGCGNLRKIVLPQGLEYIGSSAFFLCEELRDITIPPKTVVSASILSRTPFEDESPTEVLYKDGWALGYVREPSTTVLRLQKGTEKIAGLAFGADFRDEIDPYPITELILNDELRNISSLAFARTEIEKVTANCTFECVGSDIFENTPWLENRPNEVVCLANAALKNNDMDSKRLKMPSEYDGRKITLIAPKCFFGCKKLREIEISENIEVIMNRAFYCCPKLERVVIPSSVKEIRQYAFYECPKLKSVYIPETVTEIGNHAFGYIVNSDWQLERIPDFTILTESGSAAEKYARENGFGLQII